MKKKIDIIILGGSGLIGGAIVDKFLNDDKTVLNLDIIDNINKNSNYFFQKFDMSSINLKKNLENLFKKIKCPAIYIDCSYINRKYFKNTSIENISKSRLDLILKKWLSSSVIILSHILNLMKKNKIQGSAVLTSSIYGVVAQDRNIYKRTKILDNIAYTLIKSAINNLVKNAAVNYGRFGIRVNSISPGGVYSSHDKNFKNRNFIKNYLERVPLKKFANSNDLAKAYYFLSSEESSYITGISLMVDGGYSLV
jgi:NAD(P)-dependent dehydrogenase (short-subunit alcohol dehydrogenase family)